MRLATGILGRIAGLFEAKTNKVLDLLEDPAENLDFFYAKMLTGLQETRRHLADVVTERVALERQIAAAAAEAVRAEKDARAALQGGREDLARAALPRRHSALHRMDSLKQVRAAGAVDADMQRLRAELTLSNPDAEVTPELSGLAAPPHSLA